MAFKMPVDEVLQRSAAAADADADAMLQKDDGPSVALALELTRWWFG